MIASGVFNRVNKDILLSMCIQSGRTGLAFTFSIAKDDLSDFDIINENSTPLQVLAYAENTNPLKTLDLIKVHSSMNHKFLAEPQKSELH